jgi:hypothetical protein
MQVESKPEEKDRRDMSKPAEQEQSNGSMEESKVQVIPKAGGGRRRAKTCKTGASRPSEFFECKARRVEGRRTVRSI